MSPYSAVAVANYLVERARERGRPLTNMALQKILYFADGKYMAAHGRPLFEDRIEAWDYGPVVPSVYHEFKQYGAKPIRGQASVLELDSSMENWHWSTPDVPASPDAEEDRRFLDAVIDEYGDRSAADLMAASHEPGGPWAQVYRPGVRRITIPADVMSTYFSADRG